MNPVVTVTVKGKEYVVKEDQCPVCETYFAEGFAELEPVDAVVTGHDGTGEFTEPFGPVPVHTQCL